MLAVNYAWWLPPNLGADTAHEVDRLIYVMHAFMAALFVGWGAYFVYALYRFRRREGHAAEYELPKAKASKALEVGVVVIEAVLLLGFSMPVWARVKNAIPAGPDVIRIRCVAEQFAWNFQYPGKDGKLGRLRPELINKESNPMGLDPKDPDGKDDIITLNEIHMPVNRDVVIEGSSKDVIHSFFLPTLRVKQDLIPGMRFPIWTRATRTSAEFQKDSTESYALSGERFRAIAGTLVAMEDVKAPDGSVLLKTGSIFSDDAIRKLTDAGVSRVRAARQYPTEVACAQLCGNLHYRMRGYLVIDDPKGYEAWLEKQAPSGEEEEE